MMSSTYENNSHFNQELIGDIMNDDITVIKYELLLMKDLFTRVVNIVPNFDITDPKILPYGLKPHTRSVSWIVEQVM